MTADQNEETNFSLYRSPTAKSCVSPISKAFAKKKASQILKERLLNSAKSRPKDDADSNLF